MNADADQLLAKKKTTGSIVCLVAGLLVLISLFLPWMKAAKGVDLSMTLLHMKACGGDKCESISNLKMAKMLTDQYRESTERAKSWTDEEHQYRKTPSEPGTSFAYFGIATLVVGLIGALALIAAGGLALKQKFIREPIAVTTVALVALCLALVLGCVFVAVKPGDSDAGRLLGVSWPFFVFGIGVVAGIAGAQMLGKAYGPPEFDPYADPTMPT